MSEGSIITPENRLTNELVEAAKAGVDPSKVDFNQIPEAYRHQVRDILSELTKQASEPSKTSEIPKAPALIQTPPKKIQVLVDLLRLEEGFADAMETQKVFQLLKAGEKAPDFGQVLKAFSPEMLAAARNFQNPSLILKTKGRSFNDLVAAIDGHKTMPGQRDTYVDSLFSQFADLRSETWGADIVEGAAEMDVHDSDDTELILRKRLEKFAVHKKANGVNGMNRFKYIAFMMKNLKNGQPVDAEFWTMLDENPALSDSRVPGARWYPRPDYLRVRFAWVHPEFRGDGGRFRLSVGGNVL